MVGVRARVMVGVRARVRAGVRVRVMAGVMDGVRVRVRSCYPPHRCPTTGQAAVWIEQV